MREVSKTYVRGGVGAWRNIDCLSEEGGSDRADLIRDWIQQTAERGQGGAEVQFWPDKLVEIPEPLSFSVIVLQLK